jgi:glutathione S-transferase
MPANAPASPITLYDLELSGNCYKVRLFLNLIDLPYKLVPVDFLGGEHKRAPLIELSPFGEIPILVDGDLVLRDSQAILVYLARRYGGEAWLPTEPTALARVMQWVMVAENEIARGPNDARLHDKFGYKLDVNDARTKAENVQKILDKHLSRHQWLALDRPTIADIACFPYVALGHEGGVSLDAFPAVRAWIDRCKALPRFVSMPAL